MLRSTGRLRSGGAALPVTFGLQAWYRKGLGITDSSNAVSQWDDQSGYGRNLTQASGAGQPTKTADGILFDGSSDFMQTAAFALAQPFTAYFRAKLTNDVATNRDLFASLTALKPAIIFNSTNEPKVYAGAALTPVGEAMTAGQFASIGAVFNGASSVIQVDGTTSATADPGSADMDGLTLGRSEDAVQYFDGTIAEVIFYSGAHDSSQRAAMIAYLDGL